jgi:hypothetical protein
MKCPKCGYTSFAYLESCSKCGQGMAEHRAAFGLYALRLDPPDLLMAYQAAPLDVNGTTLMPASSSPLVDLDRIDEIELELAEAEGPPSAAEVGQEQVGGAVDLTPTSPPDAARELLGVESDEVEQVYDLDLEEDTDGPTLGSEVDDSRADEREEGTVEYILEIEDELELEIDDLTLEEGEESGGEDDDQR